MIELPEEIIRYILEYNADFHPNLLKCHAELLEDRPCYYKRVVAGFEPGICDSPTWHNFKKNETIRVPFSTSMGQIKYGTLYAIEITPKRHRSNRYWHSRDIILYYGWGRMSDPKFWNPIIEGGLLGDFTTHESGYY